MFAEQITEWRGKDGTEALLDAHPGGKAMIKHTLGRDFGAAFKGTIPYVKKKKAPKKKGARKAAGYPAVPWAAVLATAAVAAAAAAYHVLQDPEQLGAARRLLQLPPGWPTRDHLAHILLGVVFSIVGARALAWLGVIAPAAAAGDASPGTLGSNAAGGWSYGKVTPALVESIHQACPEEGQVHAKGDGEDADREVKKHSRDMSFHKGSPPEVVVYPASAEEVQKVVKAAHDANVPVVPRGAGSGLEGGAIPYQGGIVLDLMRMKKFELCVPIPQPPPPATFGGPHTGKRFLPPAHAHTRTRYMTRSAGAATLSSRL